MQRAISVGRDKGRGQTMDPQADGKPFAGEEFRDPRRRVLLAKTARAINGR